MKSIPLYQSVNSGAATGFIVGQNKLLTNMHVANIFDVDGRATIRLRDKNGEFVDFEVKSVLHAPDEVDLSIVEVNPTADGRNLSDGIELLEFATREEIKNVKVGDRVYNVGYPGDEEYGTMWYTEGKITRLGENFVIYDAYIVGGNSGGPLLNSDGKIIGLANVEGGEVEDDKIITYGFLLTDDLYDFVMNNI